ncbi:MAG: hypothetical protein AAF235_09250 [Planctomycetota bacterium]
MIDPAHTSRRVAARAFVLPIVILLMLVVGLTATVMLARADVQTRDVQRMVNGYTTHHAAVGVQAAVEAWIQQLGQSDVADQIDDDGFALAILPGDGTELRLYFFDAQGGVRDNVDGLPTAAAETLLPVIESLAASLPEPPRPGETLADVAPGLFRRVGPWQIGLRSAPEPVVDAIAEAVAGATRARELATRIREAQRDDDAMTPDVLARIATETEVSRFLQPTTTISRQRRQQQLTAKTHSSMHPLFHTCSYHASCAIDPQEATDNTKFVVSEGKIEASMCQRFS